MARDVPRGGVEPYPLWPGGSRYPREGLWQGKALVPAVRLKTTARLRPGLASAGPRRLLPSLAWAASAALSLHPRLNFFNFGGRLVWAGRPERVAVVLERPDAACELVVVAGAHRLERAELERRLTTGAAPPAGAWHRFRERWPRLGFALDSWSGALQRRVLEHGAPLFVSLLALPGIEEVSFTPTHAAALYPGWPEGGRLPLTLCFSHQLGNARPAGRFLLTVRELLE